MNIAHFEVSIQTIKNSVLNCMMSNRGSQTMLISDLGQNVPMFLVSVIHFTCTLVKSGYAKTILVAAWRFCSANVSQKLEMVNGQQINITNVIHGRFAQTLQRKDNAIACECLESNLVMSFLT